jgi:dihydrofolate reductase
LQAAEKENDMRKIIASEMITVDGFFAGADGELDWFVQDEELNTIALDLLRSVDTILYGRATYEMMAGFWPHATGSFADRTNQLQKIVFSKTLKETPWGEWKNAKPVNGDIAQEVSKLKQHTGKDMVIYGSGSIVQALTNLGLIDEYQLLVHPVVLGGGRPLFQDIKATVHLKLLESKTFHSGIVLLSYQSIKE